MVRFLITRPSGPSKFNFFENFIKAKFYFFVLFPIILSACTGTTEYIAPVAASSGTGSSSSSSSSCVAVSFNGISSAQAVSTSAIKLTWSAAAGGCSSVLYQVYQNGTMLYETSDIIMTVTGLSANTTYSFKVVATDGSSTAGATVAKSATTQAVGQITFNGVTAAATTTRPTSGTYKYKYPIKVSWTIAEDTNVDRYFIYPSTTSGGQDFEDACASTCSDSLSVNGTLPDCCVVSGRANSYFIFYGFADATTRYFVVRAGDGTFTDQNLIEESVTTGAKYYGYEMDINGDGLLPYPYGPDCDNDDDGYLSYWCGGVDYHDNDASSYLNGAIGWSGSESHQLVDKDRDILHCVVGDLNGDGYGDLITSAVTSTEIIVFMNDTDSTGGYVNNGVALAAYTSGNYPRELKAADFDGDLCLDVAVNNYNGFTTDFFKGNCEGVLDGAVEIFDYTDVNPVGMGVGDVDNDGDLDIVNTLYTDSTVSVLLNDGSANFTESASYSAGTNPYHVFLADVDDDGYLDILSTAYSDHVFYVFINNGDGTFADGVTYSTGAASNPKFIWVTDLDADGNLDVLTSLVGTDAAATNYGNGDGTFGAVNGWGTPNAVVDPSHVFPIDHNSNGYPALYTLAYGSRNAGGYTNTNGTITSSGTTYNASGTVYDGGANCVGDITGDGIMDLVRMGKGAGTSIITSYGY